MVNMFKEAIEKDGTLMKRINEMYNQFGTSVGIKRLFIHSNGKIDMTILFKGNETEFNRFKTFTKGKFPVEDTCMVVIKPTPEDNADYDYKLEMIDILVSK